MKITRAESFMLKVPIRREIADGMQSVSALEFVGVNVSTDEGIGGTGYTITVGAGGSVIKEVLDSLFIEPLKGKDPFNVKEIWHQLYYGKSHWIGRAGATTMAQSAVDIALWDIVAKSSGRPLWQALGGCRSADIPIYNTNAGWLNRTPDELKDEMLALLAEGYTALKMKVGKPDPREDYRRVKAVRKAIGSDVLLMVDANQSWDLMTAGTWGRKLQEFDLTWLEEPLHPDDIKAHRLLRQAVSIPIALGEHVYTTQAFRDYIDNAAVDVIQVDVCRIGGITPWMEVAALAGVNNIRVCPHAGDLMQVHQHLVKAIPNSWYLEVIPTLADGLFAHPVRLKKGTCLSPRAPGASTEFTRKGFRKYRVA
ncbi:MAG TPA: mandelate racemase/muconate lactonizing enzyme family protein [Burkholderiales bacterium]|nr:mandelate racemase/muconate lactonizing enzyme family protein [Burkholderiales bacterium]